MKIEDQVASLELSKELKELGVKQDGYFSYFQYDKWNVLLRKTSEIFDPNPYWAFNKDNLICSAPTVAELGETLPQFITQKRDKKDYLFMFYALLPFELEPFYRVSYHSSDCNVLDINIIDTKEAEARAKMVKYLIKEGIIEI